MIDLFGAKAKTGNAAQIKEWTREAFGLGDEVTVMVSELRCHETGCPPLETVIAVMRTGGEQEMYKLHKANDEVSQTDVLDLKNKR